MNILPHKSWHVRTKKNIERVRRDEEKAEEEKQKEEKRKALAESEARTELLRHKANIKEPVGVLDKNEKNTSGHINFFSDLDRTAESVNKEAELEKKAERERQEKAIGLLTYLGQSSSEALESKPWYVKAPEKKRHKEDKTLKIERTVRDEFQLKSKKLQDPLLQMSKHIEQTEKYLGVNLNKNDAFMLKKSQSSSQSSEVNLSKAPKTIAELRAERLRREQEERQKAEKLLAKLRGEEPSTEKLVLDERQMGYNSRFNPDFVKKRKSRSDDFY